MEVSVRPYSRRGQVSLDWMLIFVGLMAAALIAGAVIRTESAGQSSQFGSFVGGLRSLGQTETLVLFEDGASGNAAAWSSGARNTDHVGLGAIWLIEPGDATLTRRIILPEETVQGTLRLDLIAIDDWALEGLELSVNGRPVLRQSFSSRPDLIASQRTEILAAEGVTLRTQLEAPRELGFDSGEAALAETRLVVEMAVATTDRALDLAITPIASGDAAGGTTEATAPIWAVDNLILVAARLP